MTGGGDEEESGGRTGRTEGVADADDRHADGVRLVEAILFSAVAPMSEAELQDRLPADVPVTAVIDELRTHYEPRGVNLVPVAGGWAFRTAADLGPRLTVARPVPRKLSRAALETLAIIAYHQPLTRSEIESIRGVAVSKGMIDVLLEAGWIRPGRRRESPGRPLTWVTSTEFLDHFGLAGIGELPGLAELKAAGLLDPAGPGEAPEPGREAADGDESAADKGPETEEPGPGNA